MMPKSDEILSTVQKYRNSLTELIVGDSKLVRYILLMVGLLLLLFSELLENDPLKNFLANLSTSFISGAIVFWLIDEKYRKRQENYQFELMSTTHGARLGLAQRRIEINNEQINRLHQQVARLDKYFQDRDKSKFYLIDMLNTQSNIIGEVLKLTFENSMNLSEMVEATQAYYHHTILMGDLATRHETKVRDGDNRDRIS